MDTKKYKVLLPTNGFQVGDIVELTEAEAENYNGGESKPRLELVSEEVAAAEEQTEPSSEGAAPEDQAGIAAPQEPDQAPEATEPSTSPEQTEPSSEGAGTSEETGS